jgi:TonB family protein
MGLDKAAVDALMKWKFKPATLSGQPVNVRYVVTIKFALQ